MLIAAWLLRGPAMCQMLPDGLRVASPRTISCTKVPPCVDALLDDVAGLPVQAVVSQLRGNVRRDGAETLLVQPRQHLHRRTAADSARPVNPRRASNEPPCRPQHANSLCSAVPKVCAKRQEPPL